ncbi:MAG: DUF11 domain-containing protein [Clostridia bacterium]|nr:DUF11 domain-containing protein [Clostridia bacterium]
MPIFTNRATLSYNDIITNSNTVTGEIVEVLSAAKNAIPSTYSIGDTVTFVISIVNAGTTPYTALTVTDDLGAYSVGDTTAQPLSYVEGSVRYYQNGILSPITAEDIPPLTFSDITVPAQGNALILYEAVVTTAASPQTGSTVTNTAQIAGGGLTAPITVSDTLTADENAQLSIAKTVSPDIVAENGQLTYTFVIQNTGNTAAVATDNVRVTDIFDPILTNLTVTLDGTLLTENTDYTYDEQTGVFDTVPGRITVDAASFVQDPQTGNFIVTPGVSVLRVIGTV